ncbi:MAG TPA: hypothetical protein VHM19_00720 [Polyangiales bacterium]|nr:hypothetical protein [Polyangiales bacterium]
MRARSSSWPMVASFVRAVLAVVATWLACAMPGCSDECRDADGDGRGAHCAKGPDCDDHDPKRALRCDDAAVPDCDTYPTAEGCPCLTGEEVDCYSAPEETLGVGPCRGGTAVCGQGVFLACETAVTPESEVCNDVDDDCDGTIDEGVRSPCGGCNPECIGGVWGPPLSPFEPQGDLAVTASGELTLQRTQRAVSTLWVPNTDDGTVSRIDVAKQAESARYRTAGGAPIRVAVDHRGDAWFLDDVPDGVAMLTKIAADPTRCAAVSGKLVTSSSPRDLLAYGKDGCVVLGVPVGEKGDGARALAIDGTLSPDNEPTGDPWVGLANAHALLELDATTGKQRRRIDLPGKLAPYAGAFDPWGALWLIDRGGYLAHVDLSQSPASVDVLSVPLACYELEALALDTAGRVLLSGGGCERVVRYDPQRRRFDSTPSPDLLTPRGLVVRDDEAWLAFGSGAVGRVKQEPLKVVSTFDLASDGLMPFDSLGVSSDDTGRIWVASALGGKNGHGLVTAFDPVKEQVASQISVGFGPRALGDMTGTALGGEFASQAEAAHVFLGCGHESTARDGGTSGRLTRWKAVHLGSVVGPDAELVVAIRHAGDAADLASAPFVTLGSLPKDAQPFPLQLPDGGAVELRLTLRSHAAIGAPRISSVGVEWSCPGPD